jgi:integrase
MSVKNSHTTCSGIDWNIIVGLLYRLRKENRIKEYLLIGLGCYTGLRIGDLLKLKWCDLQQKNEITVRERKTGKIRKITINESLREIIKNACEEFSRKLSYDVNQYLFQNSQGKIISIQYLNRLIKKTFDDYGIKSQNASTHTLRKTFGKRVWEMDGQSERSLIYLSQIFNHSNVSITRRYIGIVQEDIKNIYLSL